MALSTPATLGQIGEQSQYWRYHFCRRIFKDIYGSVYIGTFECRYISELEQNSFFKVLIDTEGQYEKEKSKYDNIDNIILFNVEIQLKYIIQICIQSGIQSRPLLLYCTDCSIYSPIFCLSWYIFYLKGRCPPIQFMVNNLRRICIDLYTLATESRVCFTYNIYEYIYAHIYTFCRNRTKYRPIARTHFQNAYLYHTKQYYLQITLIFQFGLK